MSKLDTIYNDFAKDIEDYLLAKLPSDISPAVAKEIGVYVSHKCSILVSDLFVEQVRRDKMDMSRAYRRMAMPTESKKETNNG